MSRAEARKSYTKAVAIAKDVSRVDPLNAETRTKAAEAISRCDSALAE
jgi:hypothetical protein